MNSFPSRISTTRPNSAGPPPNTETTIGSRRPFTPERSSEKTRAPGLDSPTALRRPLSVATRVGFMYPSLGSSPMDFETAAPAPDSMARARDLTVTPAIPDASRSGLSSFRPAKETRSGLSTIGGGVESLPR